MGISLSLEWCMSSREAPSADPLDRLVRDTLRARFGSAQPPARVWRRIRRAVGPLSIRQRRMPSWVWDDRMPTTSILAAASFDLSSVREDSLFWRLRMGTLWFPDYVGLMMLRFGW